MKPVLDPASSMRSFYFNKTDERVVFGDIREDETHLLTNGQTIKIKPDEVMDFRAIPYPDETFEMVVFDPPHMLRLSEKSWMRKKYGVLDSENWRDDITKGFAECFRVLKTNGTLIFKWNEVSIPLKEILVLTPPNISQFLGILQVRGWVLIGYCS
jgi:SAM-dependent methyltransferase